MADNITTLDAALEAGIEATDAARAAFQRVAGLLDAIHFLAKQIDAKHIATLAVEGLLVANDSADTAFDDCATLIRSRDTAEDQRRRRHQRASRPARATRAPSRARSTKDSSQEARQ
ncbi:hypothetical protein [Paraburkholderia sp. 35.1]|uniref:hypothetical protein n=1 Tax=Paraburkholderia sp. 35.1 TaxID=2991058 RepID=UPI003D257C19